MAGHTFHFTETVPLLPGAVDSAALGVNSSSKFGPKDVNKFVKLAANDNYVLVTDGDDIEAVCVAVDGTTVNDGFSFGSVQCRFKHLEVTVSGATLSVGGTVVAGPQASLGSAQDYPVVKTGSGTVFKWRVKSLLGGTGAAGTNVLIEPLTR